MVRLVFTVFLAMVIFLVGARYGAPVWLQDIATPAFDLIEKQLAPDAGKPGAEPTVVAVQAQSEGASPTIQATLSTNSALSINQDGIDLIKEEEGLRLNSYFAGGRSYIGYGHQQKPGEPSTITEAQAEAYLRKDVSGAENTVRSIVAEPINENEFSAMVSFTYNIGEGAFSRSRVLEAINNGDHLGAADAFLTHNTVGGEFNQVIYDRRVKERALFLKPS